MKIAFYVSTHMFYHFSLVIVVIYEGVFVRSYIHQNSDEARKDTKALFTSPSQPKIFPRSPVTSKFWMHAWNIKCR
jgi:hypothetical protein